MNSQQSELSATLTYTEGYLPDSAGSGSSRSATKGQRGGGGCTGRSPEGVHRTLRVKTVVRVGERGEVQKGLTVCLKRRYP